MKTDKPNQNSGKTKWNKVKGKGESWIALRDAAKRKESGQ